MVAEIVRTRGIRGEVVARSQTDIPGRLETLKRAQVHLSDGSDIAVELEEVWPHGEHWVLKFAGCDSIADAERFRGSDLWVSRDERGSLPEGEIFRSDLIGCEVHDLETDQTIGTVESFEEYGGPLLLAVRHGAHEVLIPFVPEICRSVDLEQRTIAAVLPDGLLDL